MTQPLGMTRRDFIKAGMMAGSIGLVAPSLLDWLTPTAHAATVSATDRILVVLQLAGGNDGLNTLVPIENDFYYRARAKLAIPKASTLTFNEELGFHPALSGLKRLYDNGQLAIVQGVGYPTPNRSHFRSTEIWQTASDSNSTESYGWLGRYFDSVGSGLPATAGVCIGREATQTFASSVPHSITFEQPEQYRSMGDDDDDLPDSAENDGGSIGSLSGQTGPTHLPPLDFLKQTATAASETSGQVQAILSSTPSTPSTPRTGGRGLHNNLMVVAKLIEGRLPTRVYHLTHGGYDTHTNQLATHERLLTELGTSLDAFHSVIKKSELADKVLMMVYSEFGRRVTSNGSLGTDHGTAGPMFLIGGGVQGGTFGQMPKLDPASLDKGDLKFTVDFRSVYATVLKHHLKTNPAPILGRPFPSLSMLA